jgi:hypothetical protein
VKSYANGQDPHPCLASRRTSILLGMKIQSEGEQTEEAVRHRPPPKVVLSKPGTSLSTNAVTHPVPSDERHGGPARLETGILMVLMPC